MFSIMELIAPFLWLTTFPCDIGLSLHLRYFPHQQIFMNRRAFFTLLGAAIAWPPAARGQPGSKLPTVGLLFADAATFTPWIAAFIERSNALGWSEGRTVAFEYRWSNGPERDAEIAAEFVRLPVEVILTDGPSVSTVKRATSAIPIVFALASDPVGGGLVASLAHPGGNVTGLSLQSTDLAGKRMELLREVIPHLRRMAVMVDVGFAQSALELREARAAARTFGIEIVPIEIRRAEDIAPVFATVSGSAEALYVVGSALVDTNRTRIIKLASDARLPTLFSNLDHVKAGGLMSYGANFPDLFRRSADLVDKILRGAKPADLPVEQPVKFDLALNLKTARAIGVSIPATLLARADEVIE
jgi:putative tryptophan/tyrosine transport system substrate-binding protein